MSDLNVLLPTWVNATKFDTDIDKVRIGADSGNAEGVKNDQHRLKQACQELESLFIGYLLKEMRATVTKSGYLSGGRAEELYTSMLDGQLAKELSFKGGIGLARLLLDNLESTPPD